MNPRETALCVLIGCRREQGWVNGLLKEYIARDRLDARDAALASRLCYGVVQNRLKLDFYLSQLLAKKGKIHPVVRDILHLGMYQLLFMDRIPESAAVNESVQLAKKYGSGGSDRFVNGVLRSVKRTQFKEPMGYAEKYSHPEELIRLLKANLPKGTLEPMLIADNEAPETVAQVNTLKIDAAGLAESLVHQGVVCKPHPWMENCLILEHTGALERLNAFKEGLFYVQDAASKAAVQCAQLPQTGARVLDCCAAPGGKSFAAAIAMAGQGSILSCDIHPHKAELIANGAARLGLTNITSKVQDAAAFVPEWEGAFDAVLADAPCSGLGIIRKKPDIRYKNLEETKELPTLQRAILDNQARYVKPGGVLLYSTCTVLKRENEDAVAAFLDTHPDFSCTPLPIPGGETGMRTLIPGQNDTDGFFICRMERTK